MDLRDSASDSKFRRELRAWLAEAVPAHGEPPPKESDWAERRLTPSPDAREQAKQWRRLAGRGFDEGIVRTVLREDG